METKIKDIVAHTALNIAADSFKAKSLDFSKLMSNSLVSIIDSAYLRKKVAGYITFKDVADSKVYISLLISRMISRMLAEYTIGHEKEFQSVVKQELMATIAIIVGDYALDLKSITI